MAGEEEDGTLEVLVTVAPSCGRVIAEKALALTAAVALLGLALPASTAAATVVGAAVFDRRDLRR